MADEKELKDQRVVTMMSPSELEAIDDWMFKHRIRSRGEAIRRLCQMGLGADTNVGDLGRAINELLDVVYDIGICLEAELFKDTLPASMQEQTPKLLQRAIDATFLIMDAQSALVVEVAPMKTAELSFDAARDEATHWRQRIAKMREKTSERIDSRKAE